MNTTPVTDTPRINVLPTPAAGHVWVQVVLELDVEDFRVEHVRALRRSLGAFLDLATPSPKLVAVSRWMPIVDLELSTADAAAVIAACDQASPDWIAALGELRVRSVTVDSGSTHSPESSSPLAELLTWLRKLWGDLRARDPKQLADRMFGLACAGIAVAARWAGALLRSVAILLMVVVGAILGGPLKWVATLLPSGVAARPLPGLRKLWHERFSPRRRRRLGARIGRGLYAALHRLTELVELGVHIPESGVFGAQQEVWPREVSEAFARIGDGRLFSDDVRRAGIALVETLVVDIMAVLAQGARIVLSLVAWVLSFMWPRIEARGPFRAGRWWADQSDVVFWTMTAALGLATWVGFLVHAAA